MQGNETSETEPKTSLVQMARQLAHDLRSPLAALGVVSLNAKGCDSETRALLAKAITRIKEIADNLVRETRGEMNTLKELDIPEGAEILCVDDEPSAHGIWERRLGPYLETGEVTFHSFFSIEEAREWIAKRKASGLFQKTRLVVRL